MIKVYHNIIPLDFGCGIYVATCKDGYKEYAYNDIFQPTTNSY